MFRNIVSSITIMVRKSILCFNMRVKENNKVRDSVFFLL